MLNPGYSTWPCFTQQEQDAVAEVLASNRVNYWTGQRTREFEREFAEFSDCRRAVAVANGSVALELALRALDIGAGDEVIVTPRSFVASASSIVLLGARPVFADVDPDSGNISAATIAAQITPATRAIVPVHLAGWPCDMPAIMDLAQRHGIAVVEDCAQAHGASIGGRSVGSFGHVAAWSFCQDKIMTTGGEGGMVTTNDEELWSTMWAFKDHGKSYDAVYHCDHPPGFRWLHETIGTNWRMMEMQGAIGSIQLARMPEWSARRRAIAARYRERLARFANLVRLPWPDETMQHAAYRFYAYVNPGALAEGWDRDRIVAEASAAGAILMQGSCSEIYLERAFADTGLAPAHRLPVARELGETSLCLFTHPTLTDEEVERICDHLETVLERAVR